MKSEAGRPKRSPTYEKLVKEFEQSEYLDQTQKRIAELKAERG